MTKQKKQPSAQTTGFERVRCAHQRETIEDYVELIDELIEQKGEARIVDLAERLGVSHSTVHKVITRLRRENLVTSQPYRALFLTEQGKQLALHSRSRHHLVFSFLCLLGVDKHTAAIDAEGIEHHVSEETLSAFQRFINNENLNPSRS